MPNASSSGARKPEYLKKKIKISAPQGKTKPLLTEEELQQLIAKRQATHNQ